MTAENSRVSYDTVIPNNVGLASDHRVLKGLEQWHPGFLNWWRDMGPDGFQNVPVYLRTAVSVERDGWAQFGYVKMPDYRWGILLAPKIEDRTIGFGHYLGEPVWQEVPGEQRATLRRLIVIQGDTEPASVEQQRHLGKTAPSLYDLRNLCQVNVEEARHLWAMVYLLHKYFGRDGRDEAQELLRRRSGDSNSPRLLGAFNETTPEWLSFFMFTFFTDRDGKMQLESLAQSGFDPLARTARFMLTEEAHHMFVGQSGIARIVERTCSAMLENGLHDPYDVERIRALGVIDLPTVQRKLNFHFSVSLDLFGSEISTNAAGFFDSGIKGRYREAGIKDDHQLITATYPVLKLEQGHIKSVDAAAMPALNARLRDDYARECARGVDRWNTIIGKTDIPFTLSLPHVAFSRAVGEFGGTHADPQGHILTDDEWDERKHRFLPTVDDQAYLNSLMIPVLVPGEFAPWITPPGRPIDDKPSDFRYAKLNN